MAAELVARRACHLHRAHHPAAHRAPRPVAPRGSAQTLQYVKPASENGKPALTLLRRGGFCDVCLQQQPAEHHADEQCDPGGEQDEQKLLIGPLARFDLLLDLIELSALAEGQDLPVGLDVVRLFDALEPEGKVHRGAPDQKLGNETVQAEPLEQRRGQDDRGGEQDGENDGVAVHGFDIGGIDFLFHGFQISFDELVERNIEEGAEQEQAVDIGVALAGFP